MNHMEGLFIDADTFTCLDIKTMGVRTVCFHTQNLPCTKLAAPEKQLSQNTNNFHIWLIKVCHILLQAFLSKIMLY